MHQLARQSCIVKKVNTTRLSLERGGGRFLDALEDEIDVLQSLRDDMIPIVHDVFRTPEVTFLVMEDLSSKNCANLNQYVAHHFNYSERHVQQLGRRLVETIHYIHTRGIAHRNIQPDNILFTV